jgi:hypothetical protein
VSQAGHAEPVTPSFDGFANRVSHFELQVLNVLNARHSPAEVRSAYFAYNTVGSTIAT